MSERSRNGNRRNNEIIQKYWHTTYKVEVDTFESIEIKAEFDFAVIKGHSFDKDIEQIKDKLLSELNCLQSVQSLSKLMKIYPL